MLNIPVIFLLNNSQESVVDARAGLSLMEAAVKNSISGIDAVCGGRMVCGTCRVVIEPDWRDRVGAPNAEEAELIEALGEDISEVRLSCQIILSQSLEWLKVKVPAY